MFWSNAEMEELKGTGVVGRFAFAGHKENVLTTCCQTKLAKVTPSGITVTGSYQLSMYVVPVSSSLRDALTVNQEPTGFVSTGIKIAVLYTRTLSCHG